MWLTDGFVVTFVGRWRGAVRIHMSHVQILYTVINVQDGGGGVFQTLENLESSENFFKGGMEHKQPYCIS